MLGPLLRGPAPRRDLLGHFTRIERWLITPALGQRLRICATYRSVASSLLLFQSLNKLLNPDAEKLPNSQISMERISFLNVLHLGQPRQRAPDLGRPHIHQLGRLRSRLGPTVAMTRRKSGFRRTLRHVRGMRLLEVCVAVGRRQEAFLPGPRLRFRFVFIVKLTALLARADHLHFVAALFEAPNASGNACRPSGSHAAAALGFGASPCSPGIRSLSGVPLLAQDVPPLQGGFLAEFPVARDVGAVSALSCGRFHISLGRMRDWRPPFGHCSTAVILLSPPRITMIAETLPRWLARLLCHPRYDRGHHGRLHFLLLVEYSLVLWIHFYVILVRHMLELLRKLHHLARINSVAQTLDCLLAILVLITGLVRVKAIRSQVVEMLHVLEVFQVGFYSGLCHKCEQILRYLGWRGLIILKGEGILGSVYILAAVQISHVLLTLIGALIMRIPLLWHLLVIIPCIWMIGGHVWVLLNQGKVVAKFEGIILIVWVALEIPGVTEVLCRSSLHRSIMAHDLSLAGAVGIL